MYSSTEKPSIPTLVQSDTDINNTEQNSDIIPSDIDRILSQLEPEAPEVSTEEILRLDNGGKDLPIVKESTYDTVVVKKYSGFDLFCLTDLDGKTIIPVGKYSFIDGFDQGLARVNIVEASGKKKWGIINTDGKVILPVEYDEVWNFLGKDFHYTRIVKDGKTYDFFFDDFSMEEYIPIPRFKKYKTEETEEFDCEDYEKDECEYEDRTFERYAGSYAQDEMGYSDEEIDIIFDGDPSAYWNID